MTGRQSRAISLARHRLSGGALSGSRLNLFDHREGGDNIQPGNHSALQSAERRLGNYLGLGSCLSRSRTVNCYLSFRLNI